MARRSGFVSNARAAPPDFFFAQRFCLLWRIVTAVALRHTVHHSAPPRSGVNFCTMLAVEGLPQTSPTASPPPRQTNRRLNNNKRRRKKDSGHGQSATKQRRRPALHRQLSSANRRDKKRKCRYPGGRPGHNSHAACTARDHCTTDSAHDRSQESATAAPGSGPGLVWVNTKTHVYHSQKSRWYGTTKEGKYMSEEEAKADGNRPARNSE